jgi:hypothetical protein
MTASELLISAMGTPMEKAFSRSMETCSRGVSAWPEK